MSASVFFSVWIVQYGYTISLLALALVVPLLLEKQNSPPVPILREPKYLARHSKQVKIKDVPLDEFDLKKESDAFDNLMTQMRMIGKTNVE